MKYYNNILETIGNTPLVKLNKLTKNLKGTFLAKVETTNPGNSVKDRMALKMVKDAEAQGLIKPSRLKKTNHAGGVGGSTSPSPCERRADGRKKDSPTG